MAQAIEARACRGSPAEPRGTFVSRSRHSGGDLDVYVEYTGTAVSAIFHENVPRKSDEAFQLARQLYAKSGVTLLPPLGFNNTFAMLVRGRDARALGLHTIDDLRSVMGRWTPGFGYEFLQRDDGYRGLVRTYGLQFKAQPRAMDLSLIYRALADGEVDVIAGDATSALIDALDLAPLTDNQSYFPPYDAAPSRANDVSWGHAIGQALADLAGHVSTRHASAQRGGR